MKKLNLLCIAFLAVLTLGTFTACGGDDDDDNGGGGGSKSASINGKSYGLKYGFWATEYNNFYLEFSNVDLPNLKSIPSQIDALAITLYGVGSNITEIPVGTFEAEASFFSMKYNSSQTTYGAAVEGKVDVTITKTGSNYVVTVPQTTIYAIDTVTGDSESGEVSFSFSYSGSIAYYADMMEEGQK